MIERLPMIHQQCLQARGEGATTIKEFSSRRFAVQVVGDQEHRLGFGKRKRVPGHGAIVKRASGKAVRLQDRLRQMREAGIRSHDINEPLRRGPGAIRPVMATDGCREKKIMRGPGCLPVIPIHRCVRNLMVSESEHLGIGRAHTGNTSLLARLALTAAVFFPLRVLQGGLE